MLMDIWKYVKRFVMFFVTLCVSLIAQSADTPKYVFYFIGDGMGMGPVLATEYCNRFVEGANESLLMLQFPTVGWCQTYSASSTTTDSAAAGTALATGHKTRNGMIGMDADSIPVASVASILHDAGWGVGLVTTVAADDATPAAFYAHVPNRHHSYQIDFDAAASGFEFIAGAGMKGLDSERHDDVMQAFHDAGIGVHFGRSGIDDIDSRRVVLLNVERGRTWNVGYLMDDATTGLTLPLMTETALSHLQKYTPDKFFLMVEGGNIDHALHANDAGTAIQEIKNFNDALRIAYEFYLKHPDETLIIVTADHDTGGLAMGNNTVKYSSNFKNLRYQHRSKEVFSEELKAMLANENIPTWEEMRSKLENYLGLFSEIELTAEQEQLLKERFADTFDRRTSVDNKTLYASFDAFAEAVYGVYTELAGYGFTSNGHTGNPVPLTAIGVGASRFGALNDNTDIPTKILEITGIEDSKTSF